MKKMLIIYCLLVISAIQSYSQEIFGAVMRGDLDKTKILLEAHPEWTKKSMEIVNSMWNELGTINLEDEVQKITTPMLLITDVKDIGVPFHILEKGYKNYS